jgi:aminodeoxyfutalosine synthase
MIHRDSYLKRLEARLSAGERVSGEDALALFESKDILGIGYLADGLRRKRAGEIVTFVGNYHICYTNICKNNCRYCIFRRNPEAEDAFTLNLEEIEKLAEEFGGIHPGLKLDFFISALQKIKQRVPAVKILGFSPIEIDYFCKSEQASADEVFLALKSAGLSAITGGGAEIFSPRIRKRLGCADKIDGARWLEIMETAHRRKIYSNASILYGAGETYQERIEHLLAIRGVQDKTGGFTHFLPFAFSDKDYPPTTGYDDIKMIAVSRMLLDNFTHIRAYWSHLGLSGAQLALSFGADDLNGLRQKGRIIHSSGGGSQKAVNKSFMLEIIREAGRIPAERDILFNLIKVYD